MVCRPYRVSSMMKSEMSISNHQAYRHYCNAEDLDQIARASGGVSPHIPGITYYTMTSWRHHRNDNIRTLQLNAGLGHGKVRARAEQLEVILAQTIPQYTHTFAIGWCSCGSHFSDLIDNIYFLV